MTATIIVKGRYDVAKEEISKRLGESVYVQPIASNPHYGEQIFRVYPVTARQLNEWFCDPAQRSPYPAGALMWWGFYSA